MQVIRLHEYSTRPAAEWIDQLRAVASSEESGVIGEDGDVVGTLLSPDLSRTMLADRLLQGLDRSSEQLDRILERLDEEIVE